MHRRAFHRLLIPAALLVLLAQCAPVLWRMHCLVSGRNVTSFFEPKTCGPLQDASSEGSVGMACCEYDHVGGKPADLLKAAKEPFPTLKALPLLHCFEAHTLRMEGVSQARDARPPPLDASDRVVLNHTLLL